MGRKWPLVAFTVLGQAAVGLYLCAGLPLFLIRGFASSGSDGAARLTLVLVVLGLIAAATTLSVFHLHHPVRAYRVLSNLASSWLSREILFELAFLATSAPLGFCEWRHLGGATFAKTLFVLGGLAGLMFLVSMSRLYMLPAIPVWNRISTPLSFFLTAAVLGSSAAALILSLSGEPSPGLRPFLIIGVGGLVASLLSAVTLTPVHGILRARWGPSLRPPASGSILLHAARLLFLAAGGIILAAVMTANEGRGVTAAPVPTLLAVGLGLAAAGEIDGRFLFYRLLCPIRNLRYSS